MEKKINCVIYSRVSTLGQNYERQINELREYASKQNYNIVKIFAEKVSGAKRVEDRKAMSELLEYVTANHIDKVLIYEASRLSRRVVDFMTIIEKLNERHVSLFILQNGFETLLPDGKEDPMVSLMLGIMANFCTLERNLIRSRMASGYDNYRAKGGTVGRKSGYTKTPEQMKAEYAEELRLLRRGLSLRNVSKITSTSINTLRKLKSIC